MDIHVPQWTPDGVVTIILEHIHVMPIDQQSLKFLAFGPRDQPVIDKQAVDQKMATRGYPGQATIHFGPIDESKGLRVLEFEYRFF